MGINKKRFPLPFIIANILAWNAISIANAEYLMTIPLEKSQGGSLPDGSVSITSDWQSSQTIYGEWIDQGHPYGCSNWSPSTSTITIGQSFTQTATDCNQDQTRTAQDTEIESISGIVQNSGDPYTELRTITVPSTRESVGTMETWIATSPTYTSWTNVGAVYDCQTWSPSPTTITIGTSFTQNSNDCKQSQERSRQNREIETTTNQIRNVGTPTNESQIVTVSSTRNAIGSKETWIAADPTYTSWVNTNALYGCTNWTPAGSTKTATATFTQTATNCKTDQSRTRQNREQETTTLAYRNNGSAITENQILSNQTATRSYTVTLGSWTNNGNVTGCSWSPATSTKPKGESFTQTATDCKQAQTRTRVEKYVDHKSGATVQVSSTSESRTITVSSTRTAIGTKVAKDCRMTKLGDYGWFKGTLSIVDWGGNRLKSSFAGSSFTSGGYLYTMGSFHGNMAYDVCREPI